MPKRKVDTARPLVGHSHLWHDDQYLILDCGHLYRVGRYQSAPWRRVRCRDCAEGFPPKYDQEQLAQLREAARRRALPLPTPAQVRELVERNPGLDAGQLEEAAVLAGFNLSVYAMARAQEAGAVVSPSGSPLGPFEPGEGR